MENQLTSQVNAARNWFGESVLVKIGLIGFLTLILLIPSNGIQELIKERQDRQAEVTREISDKWSGKQLVDGPVLVLPYYPSDTNIYILPEQLNIVSKVIPEVLHRGIFDAVVYTTKISVNGKFSALELSKSGINPNLIQWDKAKVVIGLSDLKGLKNNPSILIDGTLQSLEPDFGSLDLFNHNLITLPNLQRKKATNLSFNFELNLRGSTELTFQHLGKNTDVTVQGSWVNPSFIGRYLPEKRKVASKEFSANWKLAHFNRTLPQQWIAKNSVIESRTPLPEKNVREHSYDAAQEVSPSGDNTFGVRFILGLDQYQKTMRCAKYSPLIILLTFISLLFSELMLNRKVHFLQYVLIGIAMTVYYTLLLSFTEQIGFNGAYLIASIATIVLISSFIAALLKNIKPAIVFASILSIFYGFIYVIIQLQDLALIVGSIGLFVIISVTMFLSARIDWSKSRNQI